MARGPSLRLLLGVLAASVALAGCGAGSGSPTKGAHSRTGGGAGGGVSRDARKPSGRRQPRAQRLTLEEMREYDANEGRCKDDGGRVRDPGTIDAYCSFPARSNDFQLIESSHAKQPAGEGE